MPLHIFKYLTRFLEDLVYRIDSSLGGEDEASIKENREVFKEQIMLSLLSKALEIINDVLFMKDAELQTKYADYFTYIHKILDK